MILIPNSWGSILMEQNDCHNPAGSPEGGQFCSKGGPTRPKVAQAEELIRSAQVPVEDPEWEEQPIVLFHSGDASIDQELAGGIDPRFGEWLDEVLAGATDEEELADEIRDQDPVAFFSREPGWVSMKVARKLGKTVHDVTEDDIRQHGQLSIVIGAPSDFMEMKDEGGYGSLGSKDLESYDVPFGVEPNDIFSTGSVVPAITLTGDDLVEFLHRNYPDANITVERPMRRRPWR